MSDKVTITKEEYKDLLRDREILGALIEVGVDNWDGYAAAMDLLED